MMNWFKQALVNCLSTVCRIAPLQNIVVFNSFNGRNISDDPKYIALELLRRGANVRIMWILKRHSDVTDIPEGIEPLWIGSLRLYIYMSIAKVWVSNCRDMASKARKRKGQYYIQTWHATLGLKKVGSENLKSSAVSRAYAIRDAKATDLMYANNDRYVDLYRNKFWHEGTVLKCGVPRISFLQRPSTDTKARVSRLLSFDVRKKIVIYAPTFRDDDREAFEVYLYDYKRIIDALGKKFGSDFVMLIRLHPNVANRQAVHRFSFDEKIINATNYPDMHELMSAADVLITDFSSSMFDYGIIRKPVFLVAKDYEHYVSVDRSLEFDPKTELPFDFCESEEELIAAIERFDGDRYKEKCKVFYDSIGLEDYGDGDKVLADIVMSKMTE